MLLGVPVLKRYDLLERLLASAEAGSLVPSGYLVVDNGGEFRGKLEGSDVVQKILARGGDVRVLEPGGNIGVAAAWNAILDEAGDDAVVISNDDVELGDDAIDTLVSFDDAMPGPFLPHLIIADGGPDANGWCLFVHSPALFRKVGPYDESFHPAYYEDSDYRRRMKLEGIEPILVKTDFKHVGFGSRSDETNKILRRSLEQFERKWGGDPRGDESLLFRQPFDGAPVAYSLRKRSYRGAWRKLERRIYRWDVINAIAKMIGAKSYLEIGVGSGETMRKIEIQHKVGVDPNPTGDGVLAAQTFYRTTSDDFFRSDDARRFDIAFVDGLHHTDQAYRDVMNACEVARVVVVHDANPTTCEMQKVPQQQGEWTGDVWKTIAKIRRESVHAVRTVDRDYGVAVVIPNHHESPVDLPAETYDDLCRHRQELLGLVSFDECIEWVRNSFSGEKGESGSRGEVVVTTIFE